MNSNIIFNLVCPYTFSSVNQFAYHKPISATYSPRSYSYHLRLLPSLEISSAQYTHKCITILSATAEQANIIELHNEDRSGYIFGGKSRIFLE